MQEKKNIDRDLVDVTPEMLRAAQLRSELGAFACSNWSGGYSAIEELFRVMVAAAPVSAEPVAYLDLGAGGYMDVGTDLTDEQLAALPKGRHMLAIVGTYGVEGFTAAPVAAQAQQPVSGADLHRDEEIKALDEAWKNGICHAVGEYTAAKIAWLRRAALAQQDADPLQGAADWLVNYRGFSEPRSLAQQLGIGYNRASRLFDAARKESGQ